MRRILTLILGLIISSIFIYAQDSVIDKLFIRASEFSNKGDYASAIDSWDMFLQKVYEMEGNENEHYFIGILFKAKDLMKLENYQNAETILLSAKFPKTGVALNLSLDYNKTLGECKYKLGKIQDAFLYYKDAYDYLLEYKEYFFENNDENFHWCWSDELCSISLKIAGLYRQNGEYLNAESAIKHAFENMRQDSDRCWEFNGIGLYRSCFQELMLIYNDVISYAVENDDKELAINVYEIAFSTSKSYPSLIGYINLDNVQYIFTKFLETDINKGIATIDAYIDSKHLYWDYSYQQELDSLENCLISKQFEYIVFGHLCQDLKLYDHAEKYYRCAKQYLEDHQLKNTEDYLNVLDDLSYLLELKHTSK